MLIADAGDNEPKRKFILGADVVINLGVFFVFKYLDFVIANINGLLGTEIPLTNIALPIGISFFTFQALSYVVDVYRKKAAVQKNPFYVGLYIALFPQLIAGPIVRYETIAEQIMVRTENREKFTQGIVRFMTGIGKKILLADTTALFADRIIPQIAAGNVTSVSMAWLATIAYTLQIYYDFSSYSDMAIGLGKMFGFEFEENFNYPYIAKSVKDFWRRWHISMTTWFRDYVYISLGGSRKGPARTYFNLFVVWVLTGVWHGAGWTYILWAMFYLVLQIAENVSGLDKKWKMPSWLAHIYTLLAIVIGMTIFRAPTVAGAVTHLKLMFGIGSEMFLDATSLFYLKDNWIYFLAAIIFSTPVGKKIAKYERLHHVLLAGVFLISLVYIMKQTYSPFIYFSF